MQPEDKAWEAINLIAETNEPLATVLAELLRKQEVIRKNQEEVVSYLITHILNGQGNTLDLTVIARMLKGGS